MWHGTLPLKQVRIIGWSWLHDYMGASNTGIYHAHEESRLPPPRCALQPAKNNLIKWTLWVDSSEQDCLCLLAQFFHLDIHI